ncbi:MAG: hypothetical protein JJ971_08840 [Balneolaceae bacterium]|nr:hypothetical protein [Balneolaceae bacterium]MBO6546653.1 hypothetical protein [Balneolaceae bacterium]MBO6649011.1 hypothetical protein [Balneolaceae bacterium]
MSAPEEIEYESFEEDLSILVQTLKESFESTDAEYHVDEHNETLYIKLEGLDDYSQDEIVEIAGPILEELDMDFEEIILLPL